MLKSFYLPDQIEAGCDEAGRGCLAGPVYAAAVILPQNFRHRDIDDSKKLSREERLRLRPIIQKRDISWAVARIEPEEIDRINILNASFKAMHHAIRMLSIRPQMLLIDGNRFHRFEDIPHQCIIEGDGKYLSIAAASVLAKTYRDDYMESLHHQFPNYGWNTNKGYPCKKHRAGLVDFGVTPHHRLSYNLFGNPEDPLLFDVEEMES